MLEAGLNQMKTLQGYLHQHNSVRSGPEINENFCKVTCISSVRSGPKFNEKVTCISSVRSGPEFTEKVTCISSVRSGSELNENLTCSVRSGPEENENLCKVTCISTAVLEAGLN